MSYTDKKNSEKRLPRKSIIRRMLIMLNLKTQKELAESMDIDPQKISDFITRDDSTFYKRIIDFAEKNNLSLDGLIGGNKKKLETVGDYDKEALKEGAIQHGKDDIPPYTEEQTDWWTALLNSFDGRQWRLAGKPERRKVKRLDYGHPNLRKIKYTYS